MSLEGPKPERLAELRGELYASMPRKWWRFLTSLRDRLPGGKASGMSPRAFDPEQLKIGMRVELEHTPDPRIAREIAMDHLAEDPTYYTKLARVHLDGLGGRLGGLFTPWTYRWPFALGLFAAGMWLAGSKRGQRIMSAARSRR